LAGLITAYNFRKEGPAPRVYDFGSDEENELIDVSGDQIHEEYKSSDDPIPISYTYIPKSDQDNKPEETNQ
jgi:hypothetical protein